MQIKLSGHHVEITQALHDYVHGKLERIAEATIHVAGNEIFADAVDEDLYTAIDALSDKLDRQIKKYKEKVTEKHRGEKARDYPES